MKRLWILAALSTMWINGASAAVIIANAGVGEQPSGVFNWQYVVTLQPNETFRTGDTFTVYDVPNILKDAGNNPDILFSAQTGSYASLVAGTTPHQPGIGFFDDPLINNIQLSLTSPDIVPSAGTTILGTLTIRSSVGPDNFTIANYAGADLLNGNPSTSTGEVHVAAVPEADSVTMMLVGLAAFGFVALRRRQSH